MASDYNCRRGIKALCKALIITRCELPKGPRPCFQLVRRETGFVGLMNHGATSFPHVLALRDSPGARCYMNGLLQSLFHAGEFRRGAVLSIFK